jgi:hypothetical protein
MSWHDNPAETSDHNPAVRPATRTPRSSALGGIRRGIATGLLAVGLLVVGGVTVVSAADPSGAPSATTHPSGGTGDPKGDTKGAAPDAAGRPGHAANGAARGDCPDKGTGSADGPGSGGAGSSAAPSPDDSTSSPSPDDL